MELDVRNAVFEVDELQDELIKNYLIVDKVFKKAYYTDLTPKFFNYLKKKCRLNEPVSLSIMGIVRGGKSSAAISLASYLAKERGVKFTIRNIVADEFEYIESLKNENTVQGDVFVIDESKQTVYGVGSVAKRMKILDIQNIIAMKAISSIWIRPDRFSFEGAQYGLRAFGKASNVSPRLVRFMLYNLQESRDGTPIGMVYIPIFNDVDWIDDVDKLNNDYINRKSAWVHQEQMGERDVLYKIKKQKIIEFYNDVKYQNIKRKKDKEIYVRMKLGSEFTVSEIREICQAADMLLRGDINEEDFYK